MGNREKEKMISEQGLSPNGREQRISNDDVKNFIQEDPFGKNQKHVPLKKWIVNSPISKGQAVIRNSVFIKD
jgi:hypothetical protein